jgi:hypothetical protein
MHGHGDMPYYLFECFFTWKADKHAENDQSGNVKILISARPVENCLRLHR